MTEPTFRSTMSVDLVDMMATDQSVIQAAKVSTVGLNEAFENDRDQGFINFLMKNRHGSPFEHALFTFAVSAPIFVWREIMRHRIASYNEESGRYKTLEPVFYLPDNDRAIIQQGKAGAYNYVAGSADQIMMVQDAHMRTAHYAYNEYEYLLEQGIAREVARMSLPLNIYSSAYVTMNARALMNFLSLRTKDDSSTFPSYPQAEIEMVARKMEERFARAMPLTHAAFQENGRVAP